MMTFAKRLKYFRQVRGLTQLELAKRIGVCAGTVGLYEQGRRQPNNDMLKKIASELDVSVDSLLAVEEADSDDFSFALYQEAQGLSDDQRRAILEMVKVMKAGK